MEMGLKDKAACVTGASRGLGLAVAEGLAAEGCKLALCARSAEGLAAAAKSIQEKYQVEVHARPVDLAQSGEAGRFAEEVCKHFNGVDILVTNAGGPPAGRFEDFSEADWRRAVELTLLPAQALARAMLPGMRQKGWGRIVNLTSVSVKQPLAGLILSNSIRAAVVGWAKTLADEVAADGITVNNVCPGWVLTERVDALLDHQAKAQGISREKALAKIVSGIPMGRLGEPHELADLVVFLASRRASYITGVSYLIDGGLHRGMM